MVVEGAKSCSLGRGGRGVGWRRFLLGVVAALAAAVAGGDGAAALRALKLQLQLPQPPPNGNGIGGKGGARRRCCQIAASGISSLALAGCLVGLSPSPSAAALPDIVPQTYAEQVREAIPIKTIRGTWRLRESQSGEKGVCKGEVDFRGFTEDPNKGTLSYKGCNGREGKGRWLLKPCRISGGEILFSARWKIKFTDGDEVIYRGLVTRDSDSLITQGGNVRRDIHIHNGEVLKPIKQITGTLTEKKVGDFEMDLIKEASDDQKL